MHHTKQQQRKAKSNVTHQIEITTMANNKYKTKRKIGNKTQ
jgi:hypothetical protein